MGKLMNHLERQLKDPEHKKDAEDCIRLYNWVKETDKDGCVWGSRWTPLVDVTFKGFPSDKRTYRPNAAGNALLNGFEKDDRINELEKAMMKVLNQQRFGGDDISSFYDLLKGGKRWVQD